MKNKPDIVRSPWSDNNAGVEKRMWDVNAKAAGELKLMFHFPLA